MKMNLIKVLGAAAAITLLATGCKKDKDDTPAKEYLLSKLGETFIDYNAAGQVLRFGTTESFTSVFYNGDKPVKKVVTTSFALYEVDSLFYDGAGRLVRAEVYEIVSNQLEKRNTVSLAYNSSGSVNTMTIDFVNVFTNDQLVEFTYSGEHLVQRLKKEYDGTGYKVSSKEDFLAFDDKLNPLMPIYEKYLKDAPDAVHISAAGTNNVTSYKKTTYSLITGDETSVETTNFSYSYNENNLPVLCQINQGGNSVNIDMAYIEK